MSPIHITDAYELFPNRITYIVPSDEKIVNMFFVTDIHIMQLMITSAITV